MRETLIERTGSEWWKAEPAQGDWRAGRTSVESWEPPHSAVPFWAAITFTAILLFSPQAYFPELESLRPAMVPAAIGIGAYLMDRFMYGAPLLIRARELWLIGGLAAWMLVTVPFSISPGGSADFLSGQYFKTLAIFWLLSHTAVTMVRLRQTAWSLSLMATGLAVLTLNNYVSGAFIDEGSNRVLGNEGALTKNPNDLALMMNLLIPLTMALLLGSERPAVRLTLLGMLALECLTVILTFSRAGFLTLGIIFLVYAWKLRRRVERVWVYGVLVLALLCLPLLPSSYFDRMSTIIYTEADSTGSAGERWTDMTIAARHILTSPVMGSGVGMNIQAMNEARGGEWRQVHNVFLELAMDLGLPGVLLYIGLLVSCVKSTVQAQRHAAGVPEMKNLVLLAEGIQISLLGFTLAAMFHPVGYHPYFYYIAALALAAHTVSRSMRTACRE
jgi:probable O-glycosylation ligase (exosortase A-associated)